MKWKQSVIKFCLLSFIKSRCYFKNYKTFKSCYKLIISTYIPILAYSLIIELNLHMILLLHCIAKEEIMNGGKFPNVRRLSNRKPRNSIKENQKGSHTRWTRIVSKTFYILILKRNGNNITKCKNSCLLKVLGMFSISVNRVFEDRLRI